MRTIIKTVLCSLLPMVIVACAGSRQIERGNTVAVRDNFSCRIVHDTVFLRDSVRVVQRADTVFVDRVRTFYRDRLRVDTVVVRDTLRAERVEISECVVKRYPSVWWLLLFFTPLALLVRVPLLRLWRIVKNILN